MGRPSARSAVSTSGLSTSQALAARRVRRQMNGPAARQPAARPRAGGGVVQIGAVVDHIRKARGRRAGSYRRAFMGHGRCRTVRRRPCRGRRSRMVWFGPIAQRQIEGLPSPERIGAWRDLSVAEQLKRFVEDVPPGSSAGPDRTGTGRVGPGLAGDRSRCGVARTPPAVRIPNGPQADIIAAMSGNLAYDPRRVVAPDC